MFNKFKLKYGIKSNSQLVIIFIVFGITGSTAAYISDPLMELINIKKSDLNIFVYWTIRILIITFVYQIILLLVALDWLFVHLILLVVVFVLTHLIV